MRVTLKLYASLQDWLPADVRSTNRLPLDLLPTATVAQVIEAQQLPAKMCHLVLVNGVYVPPAERGVRTFSEGDELAIWPPIAGG
jgi:sulfur carrier protein ThiS